MRIDDFLVLEERPTPTNPPVGYIAIYPKTDGKLYMKDDAGLETDLTATGAGGSGISQSDSQAFASVFITY